MGNFSANSFPTDRWVSGDSLDTLPSAIASIDATMRSVFGFSVNSLTQAMDIADSGAVRIPVSLQIGASSEPVIDEILDAIPQTPGASEDTELATVQAIRQYDILDAAAQVSQGSAPDGALLQVIGTAMSWTGNQWSDEKAPLTGQGVDTSTGRLSTDYTEGTVVFATNARYNEEPVVMNFQLNHSWVEGSVVRPHLHWLQEEDNDPNWLIRWRIVKNGSAPGSWTNAAPQVTRTFAYVSGDLTQITKWAEIDMTGASVSDTVQVILYRDSGNDSTLFAGGDPYTVEAHAFEFDLHVKRDTLGSIQEYIK
ncbi:MAG: hypothetical protein ACYS7Y_32555 [Planctomycetota bacterium]|jgi:hypothetical protein